VLDKLAVDARKVTLRDGESHHEVTPGHAGSPEVTPSHSVPSRAVPSRAEPQKKLAGSAPADPPAAVESLALVPTEPDEKPPRKRSEGQQFWSWYQDGRTKNTGLVREAEPEAVALNVWLKRAVGEVGMPRLYTAAAKFVKSPKDEYWKSRGFPFLGFMTDNVWRQYVPPEERSG
jgi:hypothetical protein